MKPAAPRTRDLAEIAALHAGQIPIYEPGLAELVQSNVTHGRLSFTTLLADAVKDAEAVFIARHGGAVGGSALRVDVMEAQLKLINERIAVLKAYLSQVPKE